MRRYIVVAMVVAAAVAGCTSPAPQPSPSTTATPVELPDIGATPIITQAPSHELDATSAPAAPTESDESDALAVDVATLYYDTLIDTSLEREEWLRILKPLVTDDHYRTWLGGYESEGIDATWFEPYGKRQGDATIIEGETVSLTRVAITTSSGGGTILLVRPTAESSWLVDEIR